MFLWSPNSFKKRKLLGQNFFPQWPNFSSWLAEKFCKELATLFSREVSDSTNSHAGNKLGKPCQPVDCLQWTLSIGHRLISFVSKLWHCVDCVDCDSFSSLCFFIWIDNSLISSWPMEQCCRRLGAVTFWASRIRIRTNNDGSWAGRPKKFHYLAKKVRITLIYTVSLLPYDIFFILEDPCTY